MSLNGPPVFILYFVDCLGFFFIGERFLFLFFLSPLILPMCFGVPSFDYALLKIILFTY